jgi:NAD(P)-dependent dehydrogenase (short-subunit alcohol dehydrogenase family)
MGRAMAKHLLERGFTVTVTDTSREAAAAAGALGAAVVTTPAEVAAAADVVSPRSGPCASTGATGPKRRRDVEVPTITVSTPLLAVTPDGKTIEFKSGDADVKAAVSGSRTAITIDGAEAEREQLKAGMRCEITYDPEHEENEPQSLVCES